MKNRLIVLVCALAAYLTWYAPSAKLREWVQHSFGHPKYAGRWACFEHMFLYSTLTAIVCAIVWFFLARAKLLPPMRESFTRPRIVLAIIVGLIPLAAGIGMLAVADPKSLGWIPPSGWLMLGNVFSNFYEEFIHRGFMLTALTAVFGSFWPAALVDGILFGYEHTQYPIPLRVLIALSGLLWCWSKRRSKSLWTPYLAHEVLDTIGDLFVK
jgi:membrane protease YdiL (CAAX protease family)